MNQEEVKLPLGPRKAAALAELASQHGLDTAHEAVSFVVAAALAKLQADKLAAEREEAERLHRLALAGRAGEGTMRIGTVALATAKNKKGLDHPMFMQTVLLLRLVDGTPAHAIHNARTPVQVMVMSDENVRGPRRGVRFALETDQFVPAKHELEEPLFDTRANEFALEMRALVRAYLKATEPLFHDGDWADMPVES